MRPNLLASSPPSVVMLPPIKGFLETSFVDWPGKVAAVVFLPGCNFRCPYCHNHQLVLDGDRLGAWPFERIAAKLAELRGWVDGVCVSGGEPTLHAGLMDLLSALRGAGLLVKLDTNGSRPRIVESLLRSGLVDAVAVDVKAPLELVPYRRNAGPGSDPDAVAETLGLLGAWGGWVDVRTTVHPDLLSPDEVLRLAGQAGRLLSGNPLARFTPQRCLPEHALEASLRKRPGLKPEEFREWEAAARAAFAASTVGAAV